MHTPFSPGDHSLKIYTKSSRKGVKNVRFYEYFAYALNEWHLAELFDQAPCWFQVY